MIKQHYIKWAIACLLITIGPVEAGPDYNHKALELEKAIDLALENDAWLEGNRLRERSLRDDAVAVSQLPDPVMSLGVANLPVDSFKHDQENMTQFKVGLTQKFPKGKSLDIQSRKSLLQADLNPYMRVERQASLRQKVSELWLDSYLADQTIKLIQSERHLFEQLVDVTNARYTSAAGRARQHDVVRAQLELTKLEDRLTRLQILYETSKSQLEEWLPGEWQIIKLPDQLPDINLRVNSVNVIDAQPFILQHPKLKVIDKRIDIEQSNIELARQEYKSGWALNTAYAYRDDSPEGMERADFFSVGVSFDLPIFATNRQDKKVSAASLRKQASSTDYELVRRHLMASFEKSRVKLERLNERSGLYKNRLLTQMHEQADAALSAYTNDDGDFAEVMRAYIAELNSKIEALEIEIEKQKVKARLNYLLAGIEQKQAGVTGVDDE